MKRPDVWAIAGITLVILVAFRELWSGAAAVRFDADDLFAPYFLLIADHARQGRLLLWDPWTYAGVPVTAYPELGSFSPLVGLFGLVGGARYATFAVYVLFLIGLGAVGMCVLTRSLGVPVFGAVVAGLAYLFSGYGVGHLQHTSWFCTFVFIPWTIWRLDVALRENRSVAALEGGALWGLSGLAGYPGMILVGGLIAAIWTATSSHGRVRDRVRLLAIWFATGVVVLAPAYLGFFTETRGYSDRRSELSYDVAVNENALDPRGLLTFASPHAAIWLLVDRDWLRTAPDRPPTDPSSVSVYMMPVALWLAVVALIGAGRDRRRWGLAAIAVLGLTLAVGDALPFRGWFYWLVVPSRYFRHSSLFSSMATFAVCVLAGLGVDDVLRGPRRSGTWLTTALGLSAAAVLAIMQLAESKGSFDGIPGTTAALTHFVIAWSGLLLVAALTAVRDRGRAVAIVAVGLVVVDALIQSSICRPILLDENLMPTWRDLTAANRHGLELVRNNGIDRLLDVPISPYLNPNTNDKRVVIRVPMLSGYGSLRNKNFENLIKSEPLRGFALGKDRFWFAKEPVRCPPTEKNFRAFAARSESLRGIAAAIHPPDTIRPELPVDADASTSIAAAEGLTQLPIELVAYGPTELRFRVKVAEPGWLIATDRWAAGWRTTVNGQAADTWGGVFAFRAVEVPAGVSEIAFRYEPFGHPWLTALSWGLLAMVGGATSVPAIRGVVRIIRSP